MTHEANSELDQKVQQYSQLLRRILKSFPLPGSFRLDKGHWVTSLVYSMSIMDYDMVHIRAHLPGPAADGFVIVEPEDALMNKGMFWFMGKGEVNDPKDLVLTADNVRWLGLDFKDEDLTYISVNTPIASFDFPKSLVDTLFSNPNPEIQS